MESKNVKEQIKNFFRTWETYIDTPLLAEKLGYKTSTVRAALHALRAEKYVLYNSGPHLGKRSYSWRRARIGGREWWKD